MTKGRFTYNDLHARPHYGVLSGTSYKACSDHLPAELLPSASSSVILSMRKSQEKELSGEFRLYGHITTRYQHRIRSRAGIISFTLYTASGPYLSSPTRRSKRLSICRQYNG